MKPVRTATLLLPGIAVLALAGICMGEDKPHPKEDVMVSIDKIVIAVGKPEAMAKFYTEVFGARLKGIEMQGSTLYSGSLGNLELILCPKSIAGIKAEENTIQLRFVVQDVAKTMDAAVKAGGKRIDEGSIRDPDGNSMELIQKGS